jgi:bis(5'-nucleosyl)-tetraphosphatase (symmetrical)
MAIYAIGDVQGCFDELQALLNLINFNPTNDQLWFTGDLVNRGEKSLETLRFVKQLGTSAVTVLGNHDIHLLVSANFPERIKKKDTLQSIITAPDCDELLDWLRKQPLFHYKHDIGMMHAGIPPQWDLTKTQTLATIAQKALRADNYRDTLAQLYSDQPDRWSKDLKGIEQLRFIISAFTRMRYCTKKGQLDFQYSGELGSQPAHLMPWFDAPNRKIAPTQLIFGHWAALGYYTKNNCYCIDTGCIWGRELSALRIDTPQMEKFSVSRNTVRQDF